MSMSMSNRIVPMRRRERAGLAGWLAIRPLLDLLVKLRWMEGYGLGCGYIYIYRDRYACLVIHTIQRVKAVRRARA